MITRLARRPLTGIAKRGDTTCQHALFILRWLGRTPESFLSPVSPTSERAALPVAGSDRRLRWELFGLVIRREERYLAEALGDAYALYGQRVRRWL